MTSPARILIAEARRGLGKAHFLQGNITRALASLQSALEIFELFADPARAAELGRAGCARVKAEFSIDSMMNAYLSLYEGRA